MINYSNLTWEQLLHKIKDKFNQSNVIKEAFNRLDNTIKSKCILLEGTQSSKPITGNVEITSENNSETSLTLSKKGQVGITSNPKFKIGRIVNGGINEPKLRVLFNDDSEYKNEITCWEVEPSGTMASIRQVNGSHLEAFIGTEEKPVFRIASFLKDGNVSSRFEFGSGGNNETDIFLERWNNYSFSIVIGGSPKVVFYPDSILRQPGVVDAFQETPATQFISSPANDVKKLFFREGLGLVEKGSDGTEHLLRPQYGDIKKSYITNDHNGWIKTNGRLINTLNSQQQNILNTLGITNNLPNVSMEFIYLGQ